MALMQWCERTSVGVPELDADHKELIKVINQLDADSEDEARSRPWLGPDQPLMAELTLLVTPFDTTPYNISIVSPRLTMAAKAAMATNEARKAYSIAVAPSS